MSSLTLVNLANFDVRNELDRLPEQKPSADMMRRWLQLPEDICQALDRGVVIAIDEFQELGALERRGFAPFPLMRAVWQRHERCASIISGSAPSLLRELVTSRHSPFFQHFALFDLEPFSTDDAVSLLVESSPPDRRIAPWLAKRIVEVVGWESVYLQLVGETIVTEAPRTTRRRSSRSCRGSFSPGRADCLSTSQTSMRERSETPRPLPPRCKR